MRPSDLALLGHLPFSMGRSRRYTHRRDNKDQKDVPLLLYISATLRSLEASDGILYPGLLPGIGIFKHFSPDNNGQHLTASSQPLQHLAPVSIEFQENKQQDSEAP